MATASTERPINGGEKLPWGWHFRPTPSELIHILKKKVSRESRQPERAFESQEEEAAPAAAGDMSGVLREIDLSQVEPFEIKGIPETCSIRATHPDELNQYFYTQTEQKYRHGKGDTLNRASKGGFWKATGRDRQVLSKVNPGDKDRKVIGFRKARVFYEGRSPNDIITDWMLHEYRLHKHGDSAVKWVVCHMFKKERNNQPKGSSKVRKLAASMDLLKKQWSESVDVVLHQQQDMKVMEEVGGPNGASTSCPPGAEEESTHSVHCPYTRSDLQAQFLHVTAVRLSSSDEHQPPSLPTGGCRTATFDQLSSPLAGERVSLCDQGSQMPEGGMPHVDQHQVLLDSQAAQGQPSLCHDHHRQDIFFDWRINEPLQLSDASFETFWL